jgi:hypothetical protein
MAKQQTKKLWFRAKYYGWGWYPSSWQGWLVLLIYLLLVILDIFRIDSSSHSAFDTIRPFVIDMVILVLILLWICYRTGEKPRWRWGKE